MQDWKKLTVLSQYANSPVLMTLIESFNDALDPSIDIDLFYDSLWNIDTAVGYGLDVWGRIVNVQRTIPVQISTNYFGFAEAYDPGSPTTGPQPLGQAPFYNGSATPTYPYTLSDAEYRGLILVKAMTNISDCSARSLNRLLTLLFAGRGNAYVEDLGGMAMTFRFAFALTPVERAILSYSTAVPHPAGVSFSVISL
jgi:hypothetical protein